MNKNEYKDNFANLKYLQQQKQLGKRTDKNKSKNKSTEEIENEQKRIQGQFC